LKETPFTVHREDTREVLILAHPKFINTPKFDGLHYLESDEFVAKIYILAVVEYLTSLGYEIKKGGK
jgi:hypothetical protein